MVDRSKEFSLCLVSGELRESSKIENLFVYLVSSFNGLVRIIHV